MEFFEVIVISAALATDAATVSLANGMSCGEKKKTAHFIAPAAFGFFQGFMPLLGFFVGGAVAEAFGNFSPLLVCVILCGLGLKMLWDGFNGENDCAVSNLDFGAVLSQSVATSIDAFAVGIGFRLADVNIFFACTVIAVITFAMSAAAAFMGRFAGDKIGEKGVILGGIILVLVGIKALL